MARKTDFTKKDKEEIDVTRTIATSKTRNTSNTADTLDTMDTKKEYRFNAKFTPEEWEFLQEKKWLSRCTITQLLQDYVREDMKKHPEIVASIDELNG